MVFASSEWVNVQSCMKHSLLPHTSPSLRHRPWFVSSPGVWDSHSAGCFGLLSSLFLSGMRAFLPLGTPITKPNFVEPSLVLGGLHSFSIMESDPGWPKFTYCWFWDSLIDFHRLWHTQNLDFTKCNYYGKGPQALLERRWFAFPWSDRRGT